jgi:hypothetical protein
MFSLDVIDTDAFLEMPSTTQNLYFHLGMRGDDDGFVSSPKKIMKVVNASEDDMKILLAKQFVIPFDSGVCVIKHWRIHNYIQNDRYKETRCLAEKKRLSIQDDVYILDTNPKQSVSGTEPQVRLGKDNNLNIKRDDKNISKPGYPPNPIPPGIRPLQESMAILAASMRTE